MADTIEYLYKDSIQSDIVYPITSSLAVMRENESVEVSLNKLENRSAFPTVNFSNKLAEVTFSGDSNNPATYTATQDCFAVTYQYNGTRFSVDGFEFTGTTDRGGGSYTSVVPLRAGQTINVYGYYSRRITVFSYL